MTPLVLNITKTPQSFKGQRAAKDQEDCHLQFFDISPSSNVIKV